MRNTETLFQIHEPEELLDPSYKKKEDDVAIGIDFGTTHSVVAYRLDGCTMLVQDEDRNEIIPSIVTWDAQGGVDVGYRARNRALGDQSGELTMVSSVKRLMGRGSEDISALLGDVFPLGGDLIENKSGMVRLSVKGREYSPVEISALIFETLCRYASLQLNSPIKRAVITVPAYFDDAARTATRDAARLAGLEVLRLINEPTSAALAYGLGNSAEGIYVIYDLGGGTFDISILSLQKGIFRVLATGGDTALGGDDFDCAIAEEFLIQRKIAYPDDSLSQKEVQELLLQARSVKESLSSVREVHCLLSFADKESRHVLTQSELYDLIKPWIEKTLKISESVLSDADLDRQEVLGIVMVGGSTRIPAVQQAVGEFWGKEPLMQIDPERVVAIGAALQAEALTRGGGILLLDVLPLSLAIETIGGIAEKVIYRNTPIPVSKTCEFTTFQDGQQAMSIHIVQGEREQAEKNRSLARFTLRGIPPMAAGAARICITFSVDANGVLLVTAQETTTGVKQHIEVKPSYGLTEEETMSMLKESFYKAEEDMKWRLLEEARLDGKRLLLALYAALEHDKDLLAPIELKTMEEVMDKLEQSLQGEDREKIIKFTDSVQESTLSFAERRMNRDIQTALKGKVIEDI